MVQRRMEDRNIFYGWASEEFRKVTEMEDGGWLGFACWGVENIVNNTILLKSPVKLRLNYTRNGGFKFGAALGIDIPCTNTGLSIGEEYQLRGKDKGFDTGIGLEFKQATTDFVKSDYLKNVNIEYKMKGDLIYDAFGDNSIHSKAKFNYGLRYHAGDDIPKILNKYETSSERYLAKGYDKLDDLVSLNGGIGPGYNIGSDDSKWDWGNPVDGLPPLKGMWKNLGTWYTNSF